MVTLLNSQGMKNFKITESIYCSILTIYTNDWWTFWRVYCCHAYFFSAGFLNMCKPRTIFYLLWLAGPPGLVLYGTGLAHLPNWLGMVNSDWFGSMWSKVFFAKEIYHFSIKQATILPGQFASHNQLLIEHLLLVPECYFA